MAKTRTCEESIDDITEILHTLVVWSNIFYLLAAMVSFYGGHPVLGSIFLVIMVTSIIHHANCNFGVSERILSYADVSVATLGSLAILLYGLWFVFINRKMAIFKTKRTYMIGVFFVLLSLLALVAFGIATFAVKDINPEDPEHGVVGPIVKAVRAGDEEKVNKECYDRSRQIQYLLYHTVWHIMGGIVGVFFVTLITVI